MMLGAVGLSALLASCGGVVVISDPVQITAINEYTSDYYYNDQNGNRVYVICDNRDTNVYMDVSWTGALSRLNARFEGTQDPAIEKTTGPFVPDVSGRDTFSYTFAPGAAPLSVSKSKLSAQALKSQAIIVNPVQKGATFVTVWGYNPDGLKSNEFEAPKGIPVVDCV